MAIDNKWISDGTIDVNVWQETDHRIDFQFPRNEAGTSIANARSIGAYAKKYFTSSDKQLELIDNSWAYCAADSGFVQANLTLHIGTNISSSPTEDAGKVINYQNTGTLPIGFSRYIDFSCYGRMGLNGTRNSSTFKRSVEGTPFNTYFRVYNNNADGASRVYGADIVPAVKFDIKNVVAIPIIEAYNLKSGGDPGSADITTFDSSSKVSIQYYTLDGYKNAGYKTHPYIKALWVAYILVRPDEQNKTIVTGFMNGQYFPMVASEFKASLNVYEGDSYNTTEVTYYPVYGDDHSNAVATKAQGWDGTKLVERSLITVSHLYCLGGTPNVGTSVVAESLHQYYSSSATPSYTSEWFKSRVTTNTSDNRKWVIYYSPAITDSNIAAFDEYCMKQVAYLGLFFRRDIDFADMDYRFIDDKTYMGIIDGGGITHGEYTQGLDNAKNAQYKWTDPLNDTPFTPGGGGGGGGDRPKPDPDKNPVLPGRPGFSLATSSGSKTYTISSSEFQQMWDDIYNRENAAWEDLLEGLSLFGSNPLNAILAYRWYPFTLGGSGQSPLILGRTIVNDSHKYAYISNDNDAFYSSGGSFWYGEDKNFINSKHCKCRLWLPFYGFVELPMSQMLSKELEIDFQYNAPDDLAVWIISFGNVIYDYYECAPYIEIPITGDNSTQIAIAKQQQAINTALTIGNAAVTIGAGIAAGVATGGFGLIADAFSGGFVGGLDILAHAASYGIPASEMMGIATGLGAIGTGLNTAAKAGGNIVSGRTQTANQVGTLSTNVPTKAGASATTFLHLPMKPYIQFYTNIDMETANIAQYKRTVGIACEQWSTIGAMPDNSLLSISNPVFDTSGMTENEVNALITALGGFVK